MALTGLVALTLAAGRATLRSARGVLARLVLAIALGACAPMPAAPIAPPADAGTTGVDAAVLVAAPAGASAAPPLEAPRDGVFEATRRALRSSTEWLARGVDSWFGDKPFAHGGGVSDGRLALSLLRRQDTGTDIDVRLKARFRLPNLEAHSGYLFVGRDNQREVIADTPVEFSRQQRQRPERAADRSFFAGLGFVLRDTVDFRLGVRGGLTPYAQARYRRPWALGPSDQIDFRQTLFWSVDDHLGSTTALAYEHVYSPTLVARWANAATITQTARNFDWSSSLGAYKLLHGQRVLSLALLASGRQGSGVAFTDVGVQAKWQQPMHRDWLLGDLTIGHFWPRPDAQSERSRAWAVGAGLQLYF